MKFLNKLKYLTAIMAVMGLFPGTPPAWGGSGPKRVYDFVTLQNLDQPNTTLCRLVIEEAFRRNGFETSFQTVPVMRALEMVESGKADGDLVRLGKMTHNNYLRIDEPIYSASYVAYSVREDISVQSWEDIKTSNYRIGYLAGAKRPSNMIEQILKIDKSKRFAITTEIGNGFKMLLEDRFDIFVEGEFPTAAALRKGNFSSAGVRFAGTLETFNIHTFLNSKHKAIAPTIAETIRAMKRDGSFEKFKETAGFNN
jgi:polar amino acid transport system substrate-binding protein